MPRTAVPASTMGASNIGTVGAQKAPTVSTVEGFAAFVESAQGWLPQKRGPLPTPASPPQDQPVLARGRTLTGQGPQPAARSQNDGNQETIDLSAPQAPTVAPLPAMPEPSKVTAKQTTSPQASHVAQDSGENAVKPPDSTQAAMPIPIVSSPIVPPAITSPPISDGLATQQAVGAVAEGRKGQSDGSSASVDETLNLAPVAALQPASDPLPSPSLTNASAPIAVARALEKVVMDKPDMPAVASPDNAWSQDAGVVPAPTPTQTAATSQTVVQAGAAPTISANAAIAEANRAVALRVSRAINSGEDTLTIELHPAELGHVAVHIAFHGSGVEVQMVVGRQETFQAFSQDRAALEQQFSQAGIDLGAGGLDLRYSQTPEPKQAYGSGSLQAEAGLSEAQASNIFSSDNLVNIVA